MKVVHLGTVIQSQFGVVDEDGNVVQTFSVTPKQGEPDPLAINRLSVEAFATAGNALINVKHELQKKVDEEVAKSAGPKLAEETKDE